MIIAKQKREENVAEYILYMWQLEDLMRAFNFDKSIIEREIIDHYKLDFAKKNEVVAWYNDLLNAMFVEGITKQGHLMHVKNIVQDLSSLNISLLKDPNHSEYQKLFNDAIPAIHDIIQKSNGHIKNEIDACFNALYGILLLRLQKKEISSDTSIAIQKISLMLKYLCRIFHEQEKEFQE